MSKNNKNLTGSLITTLLLTIAMPFQVMATCVSNESCYNYNVSCCPTPCPMNPCVAPVCNDPCNPCQCNPCQCNPCACPCDPCACPCGPCFPQPCNQKRCCSSGVGIALGAIILGAAAGAGAGYAAGNNNHHHHGSKNCCPPVPAPTPSCCRCTCGQDIGETISFNFALLLDINLFIDELIGGGPNEFADGKIRITSFVVDPSGCMTTGATRKIDLTDIGGAVNIPIDDFPTLRFQGVVALVTPPGNIPFCDTICICDPCFGTYHVGLQIEFNNAPFLNIASSWVDVVTSATENSHTTLGLTLDIPASVCGLELTQVTSQFNYGPPKIPSDLTFGHN